MKRNRDTGSGSLPKSRIQFSLSSQRLNHARLCFKAVLGSLAPLGLFLMSLLVCAAAPLPAHYVDGELLVKFKGGPRGAAAEQAKNALHHEVKRNFEHVGWQHIKLPPGQTVEEALRRYRQHPGVLAAEPNYLVRAVLMGACGNVNPNDPKFNQQWGLEKIGAAKAWATTTGSSNVVVAVIDSGVDYMHEDLAANMWINRGETSGNGADDDHNGYVDDMYGIDVVSPDTNPSDGWWSIYTHGTACAGIIGAVGNNGRGLVGVNWSVQLMALRLLGANSNFVASVGFIEVCNYLLDQKSRGVNLRVTSNSWGFTDDPGEAVRSALESLGHAGILSVFAAGTQTWGGTNLDVAPIVFPQCWHVAGTINVAESDTNDNLVAYESNWGATNVDLAAPGVDIASTQGGSPYNLYYTGSSLHGTSVACPFVAGAAALLAAAYPSATMDQIKTALLESVDVVGDLTNKVASKGRLNVGRAMEHPGLSSTAPAFVTVQPQSQTNGLGCSASFCLTATGAQPIKYAWKFSGAAFAETPDPILELPGLSLNNDGDYSVVLSNAYGMSTSAVATLRVAALPIIQIQPLTQRVVDGTNLSLSVAAVGACPMTFQWQRNGTNLLNATGPSLAFPNLATCDSGDFQVVVSNSYGSVTSSVATLSVLGWPWVLEQPRHQTVAVGSNVTLSVRVANTATLPVGCNWRQDITSRGWVMLTNSSTALLQLPNIQTNSAGVWSVRFTNAAIRLLTNYSKCNDAYLTVVEPPTNQTVRFGETVTFKAKAVGPAPLRYQWQFQGLNLPNQTNGTLVLTNAGPANAGLYTVVVTNAAGEPAGFSAQLAVQVMNVVSCSNGPLQRCMELCWPTNCAVRYTSNLGDPVEAWQPWVGPVQDGPGYKCATIPVTEDMMFFRIVCGP